MAWFGLLGLLFLIIPLAYVLASVVGLSFLWYRVFKGSRRGGDMPTCGRCGYAVRGLAGLNCPECGADLREVGIVTPALRGTVSPVVFVLLWTLLLPGPGCLVSGILIAVGPKNSWAISDNLMLSGPTSGEYLNITISEFKGGPYMPGSVSVTNVMVTGNAQQYEDLDIDPVAMTYEDYTNFNPTTRNPSPPTKPLDRQALLDMLRRAGADPKRQDVIDEADEVLGIIKTMPSLGLSNVSTSLYSTNMHTPTNFDQPAGWFVLLLLLLWFTFWVFGMVFYFRIRKKHAPESKAFKRDPPRFAPPSPPPSAPSF